MKKTSGTLTIESPVTTARSKALIEGELQRRPSMPEIANILLVDGRNSITAAEMVEEGAVIEGKTYFTVIYADMTGELYSFESSADFKHKVDIKGASPSCSGLPSCSLSGIDYKLGSGGVFVRAYAEITVSVWKTEGIEALSGVSEEKGVYTREETLDIPVQTAFRNALCAVREDIRVPQNLPTVGKLLHVSGYAAVKDINTESMKLSCEGELKASFIYESTDRGAPLQSFTVSIPFGEIIGADGVSEGDTVMALCEITDISASSFEGSDDIICLDAAIKITVCAYRTEQTRVITDIYCTEKDIETKRRGVSYRGLSAFSTVKAIQRGSVPLPAGAPDVTRALFCRSACSVSRCEPMDGFVRVSGTLFTQVCYSGATGAITSFPYTSDFTAEIALDCPAGGEIISRANIEYFDIEGSGRDLDCKYALEISAAAFSKGEASLITDAFEGEALEKRGGITVCCVAERQDMWDICKKYHISPEDMARLNPSIGEKAPGAGSKLIIF